MQAVWRVTSRSEISTARLCRVRQKIKPFCLICLQNSQDSHFSSYILFIEQPAYRDNPRYTGHLVEEFLHLFLFHFSRLSIFLCLPPQLFCLRFQLPITCLPVQNPLKAYQNFRKEVVFLTKIMSFSVTVITNAEN